MSLRTDQHKKWTAEWYSLHEDIVWCEQCGSTSCWPLQMAHRLKRVELGYETEEDKKEYFMAAKLGQPCHRKYDENFNKDQTSDFDAHKIMFDGITALIEKRNGY